LVGAHDRRHDHPAPPARREPERNPDVDSRSARPEFKLTFLRTAVLDRGVLTARATALKVGRSVATADVEIWQAGELVAKGLYTYLVLADR
jgi:acyl-coenzyme A thioesterase PaaI-like protein